MSIFCCCCLAAKLCQSLLWLHEMQSVKGSLSMGFFRQEHLNGLPFPCPGDLPDPGIEPATPATSVALQTDSLLLDHWGRPRASLEGHYSAYQWKWKSLSHVLIFATPGTIRSMEFSRPRMLEWVAFPSPEDLPNPGIEPASPALQADSLPTELSGKPCLSESLLI